MRILQPAFSIDGFFGALSRARRRVLMLDYDGTLAPFRDDPAQAQPYPEVVPVLNEINGAGHTRLVIVSGRWTKSLLPVIELRQPVEIWGVHGWERLLPDGTYRIRQLAGTALAALVAADDWAEALEELGARVERKPASIAFHWRGQAAQRESRITSELQRRWADLGEPADLALHQFDGGLELRVVGCDKGDVVRTLAGESGPGAAMAYLGDDHTDEDAFRAMPQGGVAVLVRETLRPTAAQLWLRPPGELLGFLQRWHEAAGSE